MADLPETSYTRRGDLHLAYQVVGDGPKDLVMVLGFVSHLDLEWEDGPGTHGMGSFFRELASFSRLIRFDKRGTGLSDRSVAAATLEERMDDLRAVLDAAGSERAVLFGVSEGAPLSLLFAATHPQRVEALVLHGGMARATAAPDYPWAPTADEALEAASELVEPGFYRGDDLEIWAPSLADDAAARAWLGRYRRSAIGPEALAASFSMFQDIDVRHLLPAVRVPTLVLHRRGDRSVNRHAARWMAEQIPGARYVELQGRDHFPWVGDAAAVVDEVRELVTGIRVASEPDRVLATVMFTDLVASTETAGSLGDHRWRELLDAHDAVVRHQISRFRGREVKTTGDGFLVTFDGPARAIRCATAVHEAARSLGLSLRIGLHTGEVEVRGDDIGGVAVHIAQRITGEAAGEQTLVSRTVKDLVAGSGITFVDHGCRTLKGIPDEWQVLAVESA